MVAGKVKAAMGFQKSPSPATPKGGVPKPESTTTATATTPKHIPSPSSAKAPQTKAVFSRSFGVYFPRSSAQVQPRPPDVTELLRIVEELREKESCLKTKLVEQKLLKESAAIVPFLEKEISSKNAEIEGLAKRVQELQSDNQMLMAKIEEERAEMEKKVKEMEEEMVELRRSVAERNRSDSQRLICSETGESDECSSSSQRFLGLMDASARSNLLKNLKKGVKSTDNNGLNQENQKVDVADLKKEESRCSNGEETSEICES